MIKFSILIQLFLSCYLILFKVSPTLCDGDGRIVGGVDTTIEAAPYLVQIRSNDAVLCSGTLVSKEFVITAAHCFDKNPKKLSVVGGATKSYNDPGTARSLVKTFIIPKAYNNATYHMDIAVIRLKKPLEGKLIQTISMDCNYWKPGSKVKLFGWGKRNETDESIPIKLQTVEVKTIEQAWCKWLYLKRKTITDVMFCAGLAGKDSCSGDSGGPAIVNNQFCGVVSWGVGCANKNSPGVYTNLIKLSNFVTRAMRKLK